MDVPSTSRPFFGALTYFLAERNPHHVATATAQARRCGLQTNEWSAGC